MLEKAGWQGGTYGVSDTFRGECRFAFPPGILAPTVISTAYRAFDNLRCL